MCPEIGVIGAVPLADNRFLWKQRECWNFSAEQKEISFIVSGQFSLSLNS